MAAAVSIGTTVGTGVIATGALTVAFTTVYAADAITYSDTIYTWDGTTTGTDIANGKYIVTTVNEKGNFTVSEEDVLQGWGTASGTGTQASLAVWGTLAPKNGAISGYNTLRFASKSYGQDVKDIIFTFNNLSLGGIIVDKGATGYSIAFTTNSGSDRSIYLGRPDDTTSYSTINESFSLNNSGSTNAVNCLTLRGTQVINVASGKTFGLKSSVNGIQVTGNITVDGGGTLALNSASTITGSLDVTGNLSINGTILNNGSLKVSGAVDLGAALAGGAASADSNGFTGVTYTLFDANSTGTVDFSGVTAWTAGGEALEGEYADGQFTSGEKLYSIVEANSTVTSGDIEDEVGYVISGAGATLILNDIKSLSALSKGVTVDVGADNAATIEISNGLVMNATEIARTSGILHVTVGNKGELNLTTGTGSPNINGDITIKAGGEVNATVNDAIGYGGTSTKNIRMAGEDGNEATLNLAGRLTQSTNIVMGGYAEILDISPESSADPAAFDTFGGSITATGVENVIDVRLRDRNALTIDVTHEGDALLISGQVMESASGGNGAFTKTGAGTLTFSNAASFLNGHLSVQGGSTVFAKDFLLKGGLTLAAGASVSIDKDATLTVSGGTITLAGANNYGEGTLAFTGDIILDVSAWTDFDPTVADATIVLGQVGNATFDGVSSLNLTTAISNELMPVVTLDDSGNLVLAITARQLSWSMADDNSSATLVASNFDVTVNYADGAYVAEYKNGTAASEAIADGTGHVQLVRDGVMPTESGSITLESGTYAGVKFMQVGGGMVAQLGSETDQKKLTLNITGDASVEQFIDGGQGLLGWSNGNANAVLYSDIDVNVNTTGTVAGIVLTGEANAVHTIKVYGDLTANIEAGTIKAVHNANGLYDSSTNASLAAGAKGVYLEGDITYNLGKVGNDDAALTFEGNVVGSISQMNGGQTGSSKGDITININSGTYQNVYGAGANAAVDGNVVINYYGGTVGGSIAGTAGAAVSGTRVLNIGGALSGNVIDADSFTDINVLAGGSVVYTDAFILGQYLETFNMEEAGAIDVSAITSVKADLSDYECQSSTNDDGSMNFSWELMDSSIFTGLDHLLSLDAALTEVDGKLIYALSNVVTDWDPNWGGAALANQPAADDIVEISQAGNVVGSVDYLKDGMVAVRLLDNGETNLLNLGAADTPNGVFGGAYDVSYGAGSVVEADVWIEAVGGCYGAVVGGNMAGNWNGNGASTFVGDTHIIIRDDASDDKKLDIVAVVGGNFADGEKNNDYGARFTGDTYVSIYTDDVSGGIIGGSTNYHSATSYFTGNSNVYVYAVLTDAGVQFRNEGDAVVGGSFSNSGTHHFSGSANLTIDLSSYAPLYEGESFQKHVVGGFYMNGGTVVQTDGDVSLSIIGTSKDGYVATFADNVYGGGYNKGTANVTTGDVQVDITGGKYTGLVMGGVYAYTGNAVTVSGDINVSITDAELTGALYGGHNINGTGTATVTLAAGDITLTIDGESKVGDVIGGSYVTRGAADGQSLVQGNIVVNLNSGTISGDVYAAGEAGAPASGTAAHMTTASTTVNIGSDAVLTSGKTVSGSHKGTTGTGWSITGDRTLGFTSGETYSNLSGVIFKDFNVVNVAENGKVSIGEIAIHGTSFTKTGAGSLTVSDKPVAINTVTMSGGSLTLAYGVTSANGLTANVTAPSKLSLGKDVTLAALNIDMTGASATQAYIDVTGQLISDGKINVNLTGVDSLASGEYILVTSTSTALTSADINATMDAEAPAGMEYVVDVIGNNIVFRSAYLSNWVWEGNSAGEGMVWSDSEDGWKSDEGSPNGENLYFTSVGDGEVTVSGVVTPAKVAISGGEYTFVADSEGGSIELGEGGVLSIASAAHVTMAMGNANLGGTTQLAGTLVLESAAALGDTALEFNGGTLIYGTLTDGDGNKTHITTDLSAQASLADDYTGTVNIEVTDGENAVTWNAGGTALADNSGVSAVLNSGIVKTGDGQLDIIWKAGDNDTYAGAISVQDGTLCYHNSSENPATLSGSVDVAKGAHAIFVCDKVDSSEGLNLAGNITGAGVVEIGTTDKDNGRYMITGDNSAFAGTLKLSGNGTHQNHNLTHFGSGKSFGGAGTTVEVNGRGFFFTQTDAAVTTVSDIVVVGNSAGNVLSGSMGQEIIFTGSWTVAADAAFGATSQGPSATITAYLAGDLSGFEGTLRSVSANTWVMGGEGVAGSGSLDMAAVTGNGKFRVQYGTETVLNTAIKDKVDLQQYGAGKLIIASENTTSGELTVDKGKEVQLGSATATGTWVGEELLGEGTFTLVNGTLSGLTTKADTATLAVATVADSSVTVAASAASLLDSIDLVAGSKLVTDGALSVGGEGASLTMALTAANFGTDLAAISALIDAQSLTLAATEGVDVQLNQADILTALNAAGEEGDVFIKLVNGTLALADGVDVNNVITPELLSLGVRAQTTAESLAGGYVIVNGDVSGIYFTDNQEGASDATQDSIVVDDTRLAAFAGTVINKDDTLIVSADAHINNLNGQEGGSLAITDGASVVLNNEAIETGLTDPTTIGASNVLAGSLTAEEGTTVTITGTEGSSLTVGGELTADVFVVEAGTLKAQSGATVADLSIANAAAMEVAAGQTIDIAQGAIGGTLSGGEGAELSIGSEVSVGNTGSISGFDVEIGENAKLALAGKLAANDLKGGSSAEIVGDGGTLSLGGTGSYAGTLSGSGSLNVLTGSSLSLNNATGSADWGVYNEGSMLIDITESGSLTLGTLSLGADSDTTLKLNSDKGMKNLLTLGDLLIEDGADITLASTGAGQLAAGQYVIGSVTGSEGTDDIHVAFSGTAFSQWDKVNTKVYVDENGNIIIDAMKAGSNPMADVANHTNAKAGAALLWDAEAPVGGELEVLYNAVNDMIAAGNNTGANEAMASVAGSSIASLGMALSGDVDRQLRAIRNRTTTMGVNQCVVNEGMPYFNAWVNAEGNRAELDKDSLAAGYTLDSWGGTIGFDVDVNPSLTLGLAVTAMYGDLTVDGPDKLEGDFDTTYISAFARYSKRAWTHTFIATVGKLDASVERTVSHSAGRYGTKGETDGMSFGFLYEVGRTFALDDNGDAAAQLVANIAYRHTSVGGYTETGSDAALKVDDLTMDTITLGMGGRVQAVVGENLFNRTSVLEARALAKVDLGDRSSEADVALLNGSGKGTVESAELGAFGVELGAGLSIPLGDEDSGTLFFDVSAELRSGYTNVNGTVGYRINF